MERTKNMKQTGIINFGPDIVTRYWIEEAKREGKAVLILDDHAEVYEKVKQ